ncbi:uncharacterized protein AMSG_02971 [Thecamonas trahens ATCC 50062]|uniref:Uncharacterized protein n=1 Tax=Thecamonas trahens ATCC 50062 TaxID=461836 RepID=A0A0L0D2Y3_THETB|nr:hypothetical protein AMSG_02971 [Thecamonas trahens ATCC 50062]KNC46535.1 hypothetical protein AMSG_02971 [Thecamonas trahens ATCC 50062]|eukprot:XP_013760316.1 hypothetical protein AMSG_02971 [Thecamonas trahens ATCC 50062]
MRLDSIRLLCLCALSALLAVAALAVVVLAGGDEWRASAAALTLSPSPAVLRALWLAAGLTTLIVVGCGLAAVLLPAAAPVSPAIALLPLLLALLHPLWPRPNLSPVAAALVAVAVPAVATLFAGHLSAAPFAARDDPLALARILLACLAIASAVALAVLGGRVAPGTGSPSKAALALPQALAWTAAAAGLAAGVSGALVRLRARMAWPLALVSTGVAASAAVRLAPLASALFAASPGRSASICSPGVAPASLHLGDGCNAERRLVVGIAAVAALQTLVSAVLAWISVPLRPAGLVVTAAGEQPEHASYSSYSSSSYSSSSETSSHMALDSNSNSLSISISSEDEASVRSMSLSSTSGALAPMSGPLLSSSSSSRMPLIATQSLLLSPAAERPPSRAVRGGMALAALLQLVVAAAAIVHALDVADSTPTSAARHRSVAIGVAVAAALASASAAHGLFATSWLSFALHGALSLLALPTLVVHGSELYALASYPSALGLGAGDDAALAQGAVVMAAAAVIFTAATTVSLTLAAHYFFHLYPLLPSEPVPAPWGVAAPPNPSELRPPSSMSIHSSTSTEYSYLPACDIEDLAKNPLDSAGAAQPSFPSASVSRW